jgi:hypothetical protein
LACAIALVLVAGCGKPPRIDASSDEAIEASLARITARMNNDDKRKFLDACSKFIGPPPGSGGPVMKTVPGAQAERYRPLDGLTAEEVLAKAAQEGTPAGGNK